MPTAQIHITLKPTLLDTQGATVLKALHQLGHSSVQDVRIGKLIEVRLDDSLLPAQQQAQLEAMCQKLLANPVIEDFQIVINNGETPTSSTRSAPVVTKVVTQAVSTSTTNAAQISASATNPIVPISSQPIGGESTAIADPFAVSFNAYDAMSVDERLDLQGRAWNIHGTNLLQEMNNRRAAWMLVVGGRVLEVGDSLDNYPTDERISALGATHDLVPFTFTKPPQQQ